MTRRELFVVLAAAGLAAVSPLIFGARVLLTQPLWFDELLTVFVASAGSPAGVVGALANGGDGFPPLYYLIVWMAGRIAGSVTPELLRGIALVCVALALVFTYATLRRRFGIAPSGAGALAVAGHALVIEHAFEGRFYGPWLLFAAAFAWALGWRGAAPNTESARSPWLPRDVAVAMLSVVLCTIHWFGVVSLGLMCAAAVATYGAQWRSVGALRLVAPAGAGSIVFLGLTPLLVMQSSAGASIAAPALNVDLLASQGRLFFWSVVPIASVILILAHFQGRGVDGSAADEAPPLRGALRHYLAEPGVAALLGLALMPFALFIISLVGSPVLLDRYAIVSVLAWAPAVALATHALRFAGRVLALGALATLLWSAGAGLMSEKRQLRNGIRRYSDAFARAQATGVPIAFQYVPVLYSLAGAQMGAGNAVYVDLSDSVIAALFPGDSARHEAVRAERDVVHRHARVFGFPRLATVARLDSTSQFYLVASTATLPEGYQDVRRYAAALFPRHSVQQLSAYLTLLQRRNASVSTPSRVSSPPAAPPQ